MIIFVKEIRIVLFGRIIIEQSSAIRIKAFSKKELIKMMIEDMEKFMEKHNENIHNFNHRHSGYFSANKLFDTFHFDGGDGNGNIKKLYPKNLTEKDFGLVCELYDAFYNDAFMKY